MLPICFTDFGCRSLIYTCMLFQKLGKFLLEPKQVNLLQNLYGYKLHLVLLTCTRDINMLTIRKLGENGCSETYSTRLQTKMVNHPSKKPQYAIDHDRENGTNYDDRPY